MSSSGSSVAPVSRVSWVPSKEFRARESQLRAALETGRDRKRVLELWNLAKWQESRSNPWFFVTRLATTVDEHDKKNPYKSLPQHDFVWHAVDTWMREPLLLIPKSRQMHMSWIMLELHLWLAMTQPAQLVFFQSKKQEDADKLISRAAGVFRRLPVEVQQACPAEILTSSMKWKDHDSQILAIPQGAHQIRMNTASAIFSDEFAFQEECEEAYVAAQPAIEGGGKYTAVSSADPGFMQSLVEDEAGAA